MTDKPERPIINYAELPYLPRDGIQTPGNNKWATRSLFLETAEVEWEPGAMWCLSEHEIFAHGRWYPSAWMIYIHATDEYDALRKICGNVRQWEAIKRMHVHARKGSFEDTILADWQAEQAHLQRSALKLALMDGVQKMGPGYTTAARTLLQIIDGGKPVGRPKKAKKEPKDDLGDLGERVLTFRN